MDKDSLLSFKYRSRYLLEELKNKLPTKEQVESWTKQFGVGSATYLLYESILANSQQREFIDLVRKSQKNSTPVSHDVEVVIVGSGEPGVLAWGQHLDFFSSICRQCGFRTHDLLTYEDQNIADNAFLIGEYIQSNSFKKIILTIGQGSLEMSWLNRTNEKNKRYDLSSVVAWVNFGGSVDGLKQSELLLESSFKKKFLQIKSLWQKNLIEFAIQSSPKHPVWRSPISGIDSILNVSCIGFVYARDLNPIYRAQHRNLSEFGPNDSISLLIDQIIKPGFIYPMWMKSPIFHLENSELEIEKIILAVKSILLNQHMIQLGSIKREELGYQLST